MSDIRVAVAVLLAAAAVAGGCWAMPVTRPGQVAGRLLAAGGIILALAVAVVVMVVARHAFGGVISALRPRW